MTSAGVIMVDDKADLRGAISSFLALSGITVRAVADGAALDQAWQEQTADILLLDVNLPGEDGFAIARRMRRRSPVGIIMMTARGEGGGGRPDPGPGDRSGRLSGQAGGIARAAGGDPGADATLAPRAGRVRG